MRRKPKVLDQTLILLALQILEAVQLLKLADIFSSDIVEQIVIKISCACLLELCLKIRVAFLFCVEKPRVQLGRQGVFAPVMSLDEELLGRRFTLPVVIHPSCIEVGESPVYESVCHTTALSNINAACVIGIRLRQSHQTKSQLISTVHFPLHNTYLLIFKVAIQSQY